MMESEEIEYNRFVEGRILKSIKEGNNKVENIYKDVNEFMLSNNNSIEVYKFPLEKRKFNNLLKILYVSEKIDYNSIKEEFLLK